MTEGQGVVFDCNTLLQAISSPDGPAGKCVQLVLDGKFDLCLSPTAINEFRSVASRPKVIAKLHLIEERVQDFIEVLESSATLFDTVDEVFKYRRDPADAHYVNLAVAAGANLIVSRDKDLLDLMDGTDAEAVAFRIRFPSLRVIDPVQLLREVESSD